MSAVGLTFYVAGTANTNSNYFELVYSLQYILAAGSNNIPTDMPPPSAFLSADGLANAMSGVWTIQYVGFELIVLISVLVGALAFSYGRAMMVGLARNTQQNMQTTFLDLFRSGREHWRASFFSALPFALLTWLIIVATIPTYVADVYYQVASETAPVMLLNVLVIFAIVLFFLLSAMTIFIEGAIAFGEKKPVSSSSVQMIRRWPFALGAIVISVLATLIVLGLDYARTELLGATIGPLAIFTFLLLLLIVGAWRMWATAFAVALWPAKNQK